MTDENQGGVGFGPSLSQEMSVFEGIANAIRSPTHSTDPEMDASLRADAEKLESMGEDAGLTLNDLETGQCWQAALSPSEQPGTVAGSARERVIYALQAAYAHGAEEAVFDPYAAADRLYAQPSEQTGGGGERDDALIERLCVAMQDGVGCTPWENRSWDRDGGISRDLVRDSVRRILAALKPGEA